MRNADWETMTQGSFHYREPLLHWCIPHSVSRWTEPVSSKPATLSSSVRCERPGSPPRRRLWAVLFLCDRSVVSCQLLCQNQPLVFSSKGWLQTLQLVHITGEQNQRITDTCFFCCFHLNIQGIIWLFFFIFKRKFKNKTFFYNLNPDIFCLQTQSCEKSRSPFFLLELWWKILNSICVILIGYWTAVCFGVKFDFSHKMSQQKTVRNFFYKRKVLNCSCNWGKCGCQPIWMTSLGHSDFGAQV